MPIDNAVVAVDATLIALPRVENALIDCPSACPANPMPTNAAPAAAPPNAPENAPFSQPSQNDPPLATLCIPPDIPPITAPAIAPHAAPISMVASNPPAGGTSSRTATAAMSSKAVKIAFLCFS